MAGPMNPASIAMAISIGVPLSLGWCGALIAMKSRHRDPVATIMAGIAIMLMVLIGIAGALSLRWGLEPLKATLLLMGAFAIAGMMFGLLRGLRAGRGISERTALR